MKDSRYPYTYAADKLRALCGSDEHGSAKISRANASRIMAHIAECLGYSSSEPIAKAIADNCEDIKS